VIFVGETDSMAREYHRAVCNNVNIPYDSQSVGVFLAKWDDDSSPLAARSLVEGLEGKEVFLIGQRVARAFKLTKTRHPILMQENALPFGMVSCLMAVLPELDSKAWKDGAVRTFLNKCQGEQGGLFGVAG